MKKFVSDKASLILKLQRNLDLIQYLVQNASAEQLAWREAETGLSLGMIVDQLCELERGSAQIQGAKLSLNRQSQGTPAGLKQDRLKLSPSATETDFNAYVRYRHQTINLLESIPFAQWQQRVTHQKFGCLPIKELVKKIDDADQDYINQITHIIDLMPYNPLITRAIDEIRDYHQRYQSHLQQAKTVLDIGVGSGLALQHIIRQNPHLQVAGVDLRDFRRPEVKVPLQIYDGGQLPFETNRFDVALLFYVLHHCQNPCHLLTEATRVTKHKILVIEEFDQPEADPDSLDLTERRGHRALGLAPDLPYQLFNKTEFEQLLQQHNLIELSQHPLPSQTTRPVKKYLYSLKISQPRPIRSAADQDKTDSKEIM